MLSGSASGGRASRGRSGRFNERKKKYPASVQKKKKPTFGHRRYLNARSVEGCWGQPVPCICRQERQGPWWVNLLSVVVFSSFGRHTRRARRCSGSSPAVLTRDRAAFTRRVRYSHVQLITLGLVGMCERAHLHPANICEIYYGCFEGRWGPVLLSY